MRGKKPKKKDKEKYKRSAEKEEKKKNEDRWNYDGKIKRDNDNAIEGMNYKDRGTRTIWMAGLCNSRGKIVRWWLRGEMERRSKRCLEKNEKKTCDKKKKTNCAGINNIVAPHKKNPFYLTQAVSEVETESYNLRFAFSEKIHTFHLSWEISLAFNLIITVSMNCNTLLDTFMKSW